VVLTNSPCIRAESTPILGLCTRFLRASAVSRDLEPRIRGPDHNYFAVQKFLTVVQHFNSKFNKPDNAAVLHPLISIEDFIIGSLKNYQDLMNRS
jgi:hypothetical protein